MDIRASSRFTKGITSILSVALVGGGLLLVGAAPASAAPNELSVSVDTSPTPVTAGDSIEYTVTVSNIGTDSMSRLGAVFPAGVTDISCTPAATLVVGSYRADGNFVTGDTLVCTGTYVPTGADIAAGSVTNTFSGNGRNGSGGKDPLPVRSIVTTAIEAPVEKLAAVSIVTTADVDTVTPGTAVNYTTVLTNSGTSDLSSMGIFIPAGATDVNCTPAATLTVGSYRAEGTFVPGDTLTCTSRYVPTDADVEAGTFTNIFDGGGRNGSGGKDPLPVRTEVTTLVESPVEEGFAEVSLTVTANTERAVLGTPITYTATVENTGTVLFSDFFLGLPMQWTDVTCDLPVEAIVDNDMWNTQVATGQFAPGDALTCTGVYVPTQADVDRGTLDFPVIATAANDPSVGENVAQAENDIAETSVPTGETVVTPPVTEVPPTNNSGNAATPVAASGNLAYTGSDSASSIIASVIGLMALIAGATLFSVRRRNAA